MKNLLFILILIFILTSCNSVLETENPDGEFVMTAEQVNGYRQLVKDILDKEHWTYNLDELTFEDGMITSRDDANYQEIFRSSLDTGYNIEEIVGQDCVSVTLPLYYVNGDPAGMAMFGIQNDKLAQVYYLNMAGQAASLANKDIYLVPLSIQIPQNVQPRIFEQQEISLPNDSTVTLFNPFSSEFFSFESNSFWLYTFQDGEFFEKARGDFANEIIDITFLSNGLTAVLAADEDFTKILYLCDADFNIISTTELTQNYSAIQTYADKLLIASGTKLEVYAVKENELVLEQDSTKTFDCGMIDMEILTIGTDKMLAATDGVDIYLFSYDDSALLWRTHMPSGNSIEGLLSADLDGDTLSELYAQDSQATVCYVFTEDGLKTNDMVYYGNFIIGDINQDGIADYISEGILYE